MISFTLFRKELKSNYKLLILFLLVLTLYTSMITTMFDPKLGESLKIMMESMKGVFALFGMTNPGTTLLDFQINYLYGFLFIIFPLILIVLMTNRLIIRYIDRGSMSYLLATPNKRRKIIMTQAWILKLCLFCLVLFVTVLSIVLGRVMFPGQLDMGKFVLVNAGLLGLLLFLSGVCFFCSCVFNNTHLASGLGAGACIAFVLIQMISQVGEKFEFLKYFTPLTLFDAYGISALETNAIISFCVLYLAGIILYGIGIAFFCRRDIPI